jgi:hypothetical protein
MCPLLLLVPPLPPLHAHPHAHYPPPPLLPRSHFSRYQQPRTCRSGCPYPVSSPQTLLRWWNHISITFSIFSTIVVPSLSARHISACSRAVIAVTMHPTDSSNNPSPNIRFTVSPMTSSLVQTISTTLNNESRPLRFAPNEVRPVVHSLLKARTVLIVHSYTLFAILAFEFSSK